MEPGGPLRESLEGDLAQGHGAPGRQDVQDQQRPILVPRLGLEVCPGVQDVLAEGDAAQGPVGPVVLGDERTLLREPALGEAYAIRVLDSLRSSGAAAIRKHDGQQLL